MISRKTYYHPIRRIVGCGTEVYQLRIIEKYSHSIAEIHLETGVELKHLETIRFEEGRTVKDIVCDLTAYVRKLSKLKNEIKGICKHLG